MREYAVPRRRHDSIRRIRIHAEATDTGGRAAALGGYLETANLRITEKPTRGTIHADVVELAHHTFAHATAPALAVEWPRRPSSADRIVVAIARPDALVVESDDPVLYRAPGAFFIPPGTAPVHVRITAPTELVYISSDRSLLGDVHIPRHQIDTADELSEAMTAPLLSFVTAICTIGANEAEQAAPLVHVAREVVRSFISLFDDQSSGGLDLFSQAMQIIMHEHARVELSGDVIAARLGVSTRTLQAAFAAEGTTFSQQLRSVRATAARTLRADSPGISLRELAHAVGFGSVSALTRALRASPHVDD